MTDTSLLIPTDWVNRLMAFGTEVVSPESAAEFLASPPFDPYHARDAHGRSLLMLACRADARIRAAGLTQQLPPRPAGRLPAPFIQSGRVRAAELRAHALFRSLHQRRNV